jgi:predicted transcriptional regulator
MQTRQEVEFTLVLPAIRRGVSLELKRLGMKQAEVARRLQLTKAAVTQYVKGIRGSNIQIDEVTKKEITNAAINIQKEADAREEIQKILNSIKERRVVCKYHRLHNKELGKCDICFN